ncbi:MAG: TonB-dependent receptor [Bacteroidia bacterium]|nr:TonB-dependent receptor [Bacteroidia bacterium]
MKRRINVLFCLFLLSIGIVFAQTRVTGSVVDENGESVIGASIQIKGTGQGTVTDAEGRFVLNVPTESSTLVVSYVGMRTQEVLATPSMHIVLQTDTELLDELVVVGYGTQRKSDLTGAISTISSDAISRQMGSNPAQSLQGLVPGVNVMANSGAPGGSVAVRVRGIATVLGGAEPLFVVDGMPVNDITFLGNNDIESVNVLKDASATAIYGARGGNGVILITTKQGKRGKDIISLNATYGVQQINSDLNLLSGQEWLNIQNEINKTRTKPFNFTNVDSSISTNWLKEITRSAPIQNYDLSFSGGEENFKYNLSLGYLNQQGTVKKTDYERFSTKVNLDRNVNKIITVGLNTTLAVSTRNNILEGSNTVGIINSAIKLEPVVPVKNPDGSWASSKFIDYPNPVAAIEFTNDKDKVLNVVGNIYGIVNFMEGFNYKLLVGADVRRTDSYVFNPVYNVSNAQQNNISKVTRENYNRQNLLIENTLNFNRIFNKIHSVSAMLGYTTEKRVYENINASKQGTPNNKPDMQYLDAAQIGTSATALGGRIESALISYIARANYTFDDRYLLTASMRVDGSSRFGPGNRYGYFPSFAAAYKLSNEAFFKAWNQNVINTAKLRIGWGRVGNQNIDDYAFQNLLSSNAQYAYLFGQPEMLYQGLVAVAMGNRDIKWETTESTNIGVDVELLNRRLNLSVDYFDKRTKDMLFREPIPLYLGFETGPMSNVGTAKNTGFEFQAQWRDRIGDLSYNIGANLSTIHNEMLSIGSGNPLASTSLRNGSATMTKVGYPIGAFWGYKIAGIVNDNTQLAEVKKQQPKAQLGDFIYQDIAGKKDADNNDIPDGKITDADKTMIGKPLPDFHYGFNFGLEYKGVDFHAVFEGSQGNDIFNAMRYFTYDLADVTNKSKDVLNYWRPDNKNTNIPRLDGQGTNDNLRISDMYIEDGSYLRLKTVQLGYTFPTELTQRFYIQKMRVFISGQNLLTFTKYSGADPEVGQISSTNYLSRGVDIGTYPQARTYSVGINVTF